MKCRHRWSVILVVFLLLSAALLGRFVLPKLHGRDAQATASIAGASVVGEPADPAQALHSTVVRNTFERLTPTHRAALLRLMKRSPAERATVAVCFAPDTSNDAVDAFNEALYGAEPRYLQTSRWTATAMNPGGGGQGNPTILTYSFVPDGTTITGGAGEPTAPSNLFTVLNGIYGSPATWQAVYASVFARWSQLCGITYVYEPNDDGVQLGSAAGVVGVRGDLRFGGHTIDGNSGILAYNNFPQNGDMVIDTGDNYFATTSGNSIRLRNVLAHEHGHGMGQLHVCPILQTKLMEPFVSTAYDGPRHDDIRNAQRHYGDIYEPNDTAATAHNLGTPALNSTLSVGDVPAPAVTDGSTVSVDGNGDVDYYRVTTTAARRITVTVMPIGSNYDTSAQNCSGQSGSCCSGTFVNSLAVANLDVQIIGSNGVTVLASGASQPAGVAESASVIVSAAGSYYVRVFESDTPTEAQLYKMTVSIGPGLVPVQISLPDGAPTALSPGIAGSFPVQITPGEDTLIAGSQQLLYRYNTGAFLSRALTPAGTNLYTATLPAPACSDAPQFYVVAQGSQSGLITSPPGAPGTVYSAMVGTVVPTASFNFQTATGWTVSSDATLTSGTWQTGVPFNCNRGDPAADFDGSGQCFLTDNSTTTCDSDVDGGATRLLSPVFNLAGLFDATISYARWYSNTAGNAPQTDTMVVQISADGGANWTDLEVVGPTTSSPHPEVAGGWFSVSYVVPAGFLTAQFRVRFVAQDLGAGSVVEAGLDAFGIVGRQCTPLTCVRCDVNNDGAVDGRDVQTFVNALVQASATPQQDCAGDVQATPNGVIDTSDVAPFVTCLLTGG